MYINKRWHITTELCFLHGFKHSFFLLGFYRCVKWNWKYVYIHFSKSRILLFLFLIIKHGYMNLFSKGVFSIINTGAECLRISILSISRQNHWAQQNQKLASLVVIFSGSWCLRKIVLVSSKINIVQCSKNVQQGGTISI